MDNFTIFFRGTLHVLDLENLNFLNPVKLNGSEFDPLQVVMIRIRIRLDAHKMATFEGLSRQDRTAGHSFADQWALTRSKSRFRGPIHSFTLDDWIRIQFILIHITLVLI